MKQNYLLYKKTLIFQILFFVSIISLSAQNSITTTSVLENQSTDYTFNIITDSDGETWNYIDVYPVTNSTSYPSFNANSLPSDVVDIDVFFNDSIIEEVGYLRKIGASIRFDYNAIIPSGTKITIILKGIQNPAAITNLETKIIFNTGSGSPITSYSKFVDIVPNTLSISTTELSEMAVLYPNPATNYLKISGLKQQKLYTIYTITGQEILKQIAVNNKEIRIENLSKGMYFFKFENGQMIKFIKE